MKKSILQMALGTALVVASSASFADCKDVDYNNLQSVATTVVNGNTSGGFNLPMWVTIVDETGKVCHVINTNPSGSDKNGRSGESWLGSRVISAQKANTANAFSLDGFSISTANLYGLVQPGGSLYGLQHSNPVDASKAYAGSPNTYGTMADPLKNKRIGGVNVFGGGLALYNEDGKKVGAIGVSGDNSCTDHSVAWQIREGLELDNVPGGFVTAGAKGDEIVLVDIVTPNKPEHPKCGGPNGNPTIGVAP